MNCEHFFFLLPPPKLLSVLSVNRNLFSMMLQSVLRYLAHIHIHLSSERISPASTLLNSKNNATMQGKSLDIFVVNSFGSGFQVWQLKIYHYVNVFFPAKTIHIIEFHGDMQKTFESCFPLSFSYSLSPT